MSITEQPGDTTGETGTAGAKPVDDFVPSSGGWVGRAAVAALIAWLVLCVPANIASPFTIAGGEANAFSEAIIFAIIGLSLNVLIGYSGQISLGHNAFVGIGAFTSAYVVTELSQDFYLGILIAAIIGGVQALLLGLVSLRVSGLYFALVTLTYGEMARLSLFNIESLTGGTAGQLAPRPLGFESDFRYYYLCLIGLSLVVFIDWRMMQTKGGRALLALRENPRVAQTWGINTQMFTVFAFAVSGAFAGFGGALLAHRDTAVVSNPFDFQLALTFIAMTVVGGLRNRTGVIMGSLFYAFLRNGELIQFVDAITPGNLEAILENSSLPILGRVALTTEVAPTVIGPIILLVVITRFPGGFGQLTAPVQRWLGGKRFQFTEHEAEITVNDVPRVTNVLQTDEVSIRFGGVQALNAVNLQIDEHEIVGIIGPNGAGKTTLFNCITGFYEPTSGRVRYRGEDVTDLPVHKRANLGMGRTFQNVGLVKGSTAGENLKTAQHLEVTYDTVAGIFGAPNTFEVEHKTAQRAKAILDLMGIADLYDTRVQGLPYGVLKRLEIAAVLATDPDLLMLDEPASGLGPEEGEALGDLLLTLRKEFSLTIVMIDHQVPLVVRVSDYMYCLNFGQVLAEGQPDDVRNHPEVVKAYLGDDPNVSMDHH